MSNEVPSILEKPNRHSEEEVRRAEKEIMSLDERDSSENRLRFHTELQNLLIDRGLSEKELERIDLKTSFVKEDDILGAHRVVEGTVKDSNGTKRNVLLKYQGDSIFSFSIDGSRIEESIEQVQGGRFLDKWVEIADLLQRRDSHANKVRGKVVELQDYRREEERKRAEKASKAKADVALIDSLL